MVTLKNRGKFELEWNLINKEPELIAEIFSHLRIVPFRCELIAFRDVICYEAISENFAAVSGNVELPEYLIEINLDKDGKLDTAEFIPRPAIPADGD